LVDERMLSDSITICWHVGEPLTIPIYEYEQLIEIFNRVLKDVTRIQYVFQTNGTLVTSEWCAFIARHRIRIGVSLDGPRNIHDKYRVDRRGNGTFDRVTAGIRLLQQHDVPLSLLAVLHRESINVPDDIFHFFQATGVSDVCFNIEELEGINSVSSLKYSGVYDDTVRFFRRYFQLLLTTSKSHELREFTNTFRRLSAYEILNAQTTPFNTMTIDYRGNFSTFSPELIGFRSSRYPSFILGNVLDQDTSFASSLKKRLAWVGEIRKGVTRCKRECGYFLLCGGGAPSNKVAENGTLDSSTTLHCLLTLQAPIEAMLSLFEEDFCQPSVGRSVVNLGRRKITGGSRMELCRRISMLLEESAEKTPI